MGSLTLGLALLSACSTHQRNQFYLAVADADDPSPTPSVKMYRITIDARSNNVKAHLQTGFYNANAVRRLFGQVESDANAPPSTTAAGTTEFLLDPATHRWSTVDPEELFTIVYGADASAIATQIQAFAQSDDTGKQLGSLLAAASGRDKFINAVAAENKANDARDTTAKLRDAFTKAADELENSAAPTPKDVQDRLVDLANQAAKAQGLTTTFKTLADVATYLKSSTK
jgi:hypothetical protein